MLYQSSKTLFERAQKSIPGGVNSPVRAFKNVGGTPLFLKKAKGSYLYDEDARVYIDYVSSWGPMILGHGYPKIVEALKEMVEDAISFGAPTQLEISMAELIKSMSPNIDLIRMVNSGTEACMSAIRLARGYTRKNKFIKFEGCYHGHADMFLVKAGSGIATFGIQEVPGVTKGIAQDTLTAPYNDLEAVDRLLKEYSHEIAAVIIEPVAGNMGCVLPQEGFLEGLRQLCTQEGVLLIFDEVMTGFRLAPGGAQEKFGIQADLVTYGKVIGGGLPVGAFGGKAEIMNHVAPVGEVYQAGTLSGNPLAMTAGYTLLKELKEHPEFYQELAQKTQWLAQQLRQLFDSSQKKVTLNQYGSMMSLFFTDQAVNNFEDAAQANHVDFKQLFHQLLKRGVYLPPSGYESWFLGNSLTQEDLDKTLSAFKEALQELNWL